MFAYVCMHLYVCKWIMCMCIYLRRILPCSSCLSIVVTVSWTVPKLMGLRKISAASPGWAWSWSLLVRWRFQSLDQVQCLEESWVKAKRMQRCNTAMHLSTLTNKLHDCQISSDIHSVYKRDWERSSPLGCRPRCLFSGTLIVAVWKLLFSACRTMAAVAAATSVASLLGTRFRQSHNELYTRVTPVVFSVLRKNVSLLPRPFQACSASTPCLASAPFAATLAINAAISSLDAAWNHFSINTRKVSQIIAPRKEKKHPAKRSKCTRLPLVEPCPAQCWWEPAKFCSAGLHWTALVHLNPFKLVTTPEFTFYKCQCHFTHLVQRCRKMFFVSLSWAPCQGSIFAPFHAGPGDKAAVGCQKEGMK